MQNLLVAEIKKQLAIRGWSNGDLAKATGYKKSTIDAFMANLSGRNKSVAVELAICNALNIKDYNT